MHRLFLLALAPTFISVAACSGPARHAGLPGTPSSPVGTQARATATATPTAAGSESATPDEGGNGLSIAPGAAKPFTDGAARMVIDSVDAAQHAAVFALMCGRTVSSNAVIAPGFYRVDLTNAVFETTSNAANPAAGHVSDISFEDWARATATRKNWNVVVRPQGTLVSDGPTYDLCANANGG